ncbi:hypothetical protein M1D52_10675 [Olivibacter sp. SA151]|uniref:hypothetical protein n=1 Tax=Olivibacter jilunii TaxID=985016 RepID=UPI003F15848C
MSKQQKLLLFCAVLHLLHILAVNSISGINAYNLIYRQAASGHFKETIDKVLSSDACRLYSLFSGTAYSYGFFAPHVASQYMSSFRYFDAEGKLLRLEQLPAEATMEGLQRYAIWLDQFQRYLHERAEENASARFYRRYLEASIRNLMKHLLAQVDQASSLHCTIYLHEPPALIEAGKSARAAKIYEHCLIK